MKRCNATRQMVEGRAFAGGVAFMNLPSDGEFTAKMHTELARARAKFPESKTVGITLAALTEEVGELNQAILQFNHQPEKKISELQIYKEAIQVAVMAMRIAQDCELRA